MLDVGLMVGSTKHGALVIDDEETVLDANLAACALFGISRAELIGRRIHEVAKVFARAPSSTQRGERRSTTNPYDGDHGPAPGWYDPVSGEPIAHECATWPSRIDRA